MKKNIDWYDVGLFLSYLYVAAAAVFLIWAITH